MRLYRDAKQVQSNLVETARLPSVKLWAHVVHRGDATPIGMAIAPNTARGTSGSITRYGFDPVARSIALAVDELDNEKRHRNVEVSLLLDARRSIVCVIGVSRETPKCSIWLNTNSIRLRDGSITRRTLDGANFLAALGKSIPRSTRDRRVRKSDRWRQNKGKEIGNAEGQEVRSSRTAVATHREYIC